MFRVYSGKAPYVNQSVWQLVQFAYVPSFPGSEIFTSNDQIALIGKFANRIQDTDFSLAIAMAEIDKTCGMISDRAKNLAKFVAYMAKKDYKKAVKTVAGYQTNPKNYIKRTDDWAMRIAKSTAPTAQMLGARILEVQYGIKPLVQDLYEGAVWLAAMQHKPNAQRYSVRRRAVQDCVNSGAGIWYTSPRTEVKRQIIAYLSESSFIPTLNLWNPAEILWERIPFSFVCDWALPIGPYLAARGVASKLVGTFVTTTTLRKRCLGAIVKSPLGSENYTKCSKFTQDGYASPSYWAEDFVTRTVTSSLGVDLPTFKGLGRIASWQHCLNAVALLAVASKSKPDDVLRSAGRL